MRPVTPNPGRPDPRGVALCLASAVGFGAMAIFAKEAYAGGAGIPTLLAVRFTLAAVVLWALVLPRRARSLRSDLARGPALQPAPRPRPRRPLRRGGDGLVRRAAAASTPPWPSCCSTPTRPSWCSAPRPSAASGSPAAASRRSARPPRASSLVLLGRRDVDRRPARACVAAVASAVPVHRLRPRRRPRRRRSRPAAGLPRRSSPAPPSASCVYGLATGSIDLGLSAEAWVATLVAHDPLARSSRSSRSSRACSSSGSGRRRSSRPSSPSSPSASRWSSSARRSPPVQLAGGALRPRARSRLLRRG